MLPGENGSSVEDNLSQYFSIQPLNKQFLQIVAPFTVYAQFTSIKFSVGINVDYVKYQSTPTETGKCYEMEINVEDTKVMRISRESSSLQIMTDQKQLENVKYINYSGSM